MQARAQSWEAEGYLTEGEAYEVLGLAMLLAGKVADGAITQHFADLVMEKLADDIALRHPGGSAA